MAVLATAYNLKEGMAELPPGSASVWKLHILYTVVLQTFLSSKCDKKNV